MNAPEKLFEIRHEGTLIKQVPLKGLHGEELPFDRYVTLIKGGALAPNCDACRSPDARSNSCACGPEHPASARFLS